MTNLKRITFLLLALMLAACATVKGESKDEQRAFVDNMRREALTELYSKHPQAREQIAAAAGYAVFSNINTNVIFVTTSGGYGVAVGGGRKTYMRMAGGGLGLGVGLRDRRLVLIFKKSHDFESFVDNGWDLSAQAGVTAKSDKQGGEANAAKSVDFDILSYQLTKAGVAVEASVDGYKFWQDSELN